MKRGSVTLTSVTDLSLEQAATQHYAMLYRFALSLTQQEAEALDLVQQTFYLWTTKGHQLRDASRLKTWLFTTLYREHLGARRKRQRFQHVELEVLEHELPEVPVAAVERADADTVLQALLQVDEIYRTPLTLFYLENLSYKQIAELTGVPPGTVMSRLSRGKEQLRHRLAGKVEVKAGVLKSESVPKSQLKP